MSYVGLQGTSSDPLRAFGEQAASWIVTSIHEVPASQREHALRMLLDRVDPTLWQMVTTKAGAYRAGGRSQDQALERALAMSMTEGMLRELVAMGSGRAPMGAYEEMGWSIGGSVKKAGSAIGDAAGDAGRWAVKGAKKIGGFACDVVTSDAGGGAASAAGMVAGGPAGSAGVAFAASLCPAKKVPAAKGGGYAAPSSKLPSWVLPAAAVGGGVLLLLVLKKK